MNMLSSASNIFKILKLGVQSQQTVAMLNKMCVRNPFIKYWTADCKRFCSRSKTCWRCGSTNNISMFCSDCEVLQEPDKNQNYFDILGITKAYDIENNVLMKKYRNLQSLLHPDKYGQKSKEEQKISEEYSSLVNNAYTTLYHPLTRGLYLLNLEGITIEEDKLQSQQDFLLKIMEVNEEIEEIQTIVDLDLLDISNKKLLEDLSRDVSKAFEDQDFVKAKEILVKMKYYVTVDSKIKSKREQLGF